jgi:hypothetical protein
MRMTFSTLLTPTRDSEIRRLGTSAWTSGTWGRGLGSIDSERTEADSPARND